MIDPSQMDPTSFILFIFLKEPIHLFYLVKHTTHCSVKKNQHGDLPLILSLTSSSVVNRTDLTFCTRETHECQIFRVVIKIQKTREHLNYLWDNPIPILWNGDMFKKSMKKSIHVLEAYSLDIICIILQELGPSLVA